jgi:predicted kinase
MIKSAILEDDVSFEIAGKLAYSVDWETAENTIKQERSVIIDSTSNYQETINRGYELALKYGFTY